MNWDIVRFDWARARAFLATAETGSLSGAARVLKLAQPTVGRQVEALEQARGLSVESAALRGEFPVTRDTDP